MLHENLYGGPRNGDKDDKAHPPIHPVKVAGEKDFESPMELKIYDLICRHFLASLSKDAIGNKTSVEISVGEELFSTAGLNIDK